MLVVTWWMDSGHRCRSKIHRSSIRTRLQFTKPLWRHSVCPNFNLRDSCHEFIRHVPKIQNWITRNKNDAERNITLVKESVPILYTMRHHFVLVFLYFDEFLFYRILIVGRVKFEQFLGYFIALRGMSKPSNLKTEYSSAVFYIKYIVLQSVSLSNIFPA